MGLLDEAIRDHLELKRRRGADPGEIAREEREALEPVFPDEPRPAALDGEPQAADLIDPAAPHGDPLAVPRKAGGRRPRRRGCRRRGGTRGGAKAQPVALSGLGQETAELDMEAVLEQDAANAAEASADGEAPVAAAPPAPAHAEATVEDELLEWEMPDRAAEPPPEPIPGQERLSFE